jgi:hypothetical protein
MGDSERSTLKCKPTSVHDGFIHIWDLCGGSSDSIKILQERGQLMNNSTPTLLPIGTVVKLKKVEKPVMIYGRHQIQKKTNNIFDYIAVPYPEGNLTDEFNVFFNRELIEDIMHPGLVSPAEELMREKVEAEIQKNQRNENNHRED